MQIFLKRWFLVVLCMLIYLLNVPYFSNQIVFDDHNIFNNLLVYDLSLEFFSSKARTLPYFLIGFIHVLSNGYLTWNRYLSTVLAALVIVALYFFLSRALSRVVADKTLSRQIISLVCLWMALNPVAIYANGYLIQRTIVLATLFGIVSVTLYLRAQQEERSVDLLSAALLAFLSVMSKEHAVLLPVATIMLTPLVIDWNRRSILRAIGFFILTLPGAVWAIFHHGKEVLGGGYEIFFSDVLSQIVRPEYVETSFELWLMSAVTQLLLFWRYIFLWLIPNPAWMSADMRIDFSSLWADPLVFAGAFFTVVMLIGTAVYWLYRPSRRKLSVLAAALLFAAIPFAVELSTVRIQEPFVLYRSFLWMPAYALLFCLLVASGYEWVRRYGIIASRAFWATAFTGALTLFPLAQDRLHSFSNDETLWQDALNKLPRLDVAGADRIYYNLAGEAYKRKNYQEALDWSEKVVVQNPGAFQGYLAKGTSLLALHQIDTAGQAFEEAERHHPPKQFLGYIEFKRCAVSEAQGDREETIACLRRSAKMGYEGAGVRLRMAGIAIEK